MPEPNVLQVETDADELAAAAYKEQDGIVEPEKKPEETLPEPSQEKPEEVVPEPSEEEPTEEEKAAQEQEARESEEVENNRILEAEDDTLDETQLAKKVELVAAKEAAEAAAQKPEEEIVREHALKHNLTIAEAQEDIDKTKAIVEKYKGDPVELARALKHTQSGYDQLKSKESKPQVIVQKDPTAEIREFAESNKDKIIENFRKKFPAKSEAMTDEVIIEESVAQAERDYEVWQKTETEKISKNAVEKREQLLVSIPEGDKQFIPDVKALLSRTPDSQIVHESFDIKDLVYHARGSYYTSDRVKSIEAAAFKRGKENPKILGVKTPVSGGPAPKVPASSGVGGLNSDQKDRALEMFSAEDGYSEDQAYAAFKDTFKDELKKDKNYM